MLTARIFGERVSVNYIRRELSWDRYNGNADRIVRLTLASEGEQVDGRVLGNMTDDPIRQIPEVRAIAKLHEVYRPDLKYQGTYLTAEEKVFRVNRDFLGTFTWKSKVSRCRLPVFIRIFRRPRTGEGTR